MKAKIDAIQELLKFASEMEADQVRDWKQKRAAPPQPEPGDLDSDDSV